MWYVNVFETTLINNVVEASFILTMWYVNCFINIVYRTNCFCFILTMWYVNKILLWQFNNIDYSFILTMWYVNEKITMYLQAKKLVLY